MANITRNYLSISGAQSDVDEITSILRDGSEPLVYANVGSDDDAIALDIAVHEKPGEITYEFCTAWSAPWIFVHDLVGKIEIDSRRLRVEFFADSETGSSERYEYVPYEAEEDEAEGEDDQQSDQQRNVAAWLGKADAELPPFIANGEDRA